MIRKTAGIVGLTLITATMAFGQGMAEADKTLSPYFLVISDDPAVEQFPLKSTGAEVNIAGVIADVRVTQVYKNEGKRTIEAIYVFPASSRAAVYGMKMTIGERTIIAKVREREKARQEYEEAKKEGKSASLLEQQRPNVFQMNVANILPGDEIKVELSYTELLVPTDAVYEFIYPTVVGPRYSNQPEASAPASEKWIQNPYLREGEAVPYSFDLSVNLAASMPIQEVSCTSHKVNIDYDGPAVASITLDPTEKGGGNRDYILKYRLSGKKIDTGLLLYEGDSENFFLLMLQPPNQVTSENIPLREYIFIVDVSGSMHGFPLDTSKALLKNLIGNLRKTDVFNVLLFSGGSTLMSERSLPATAENISKAIYIIDNQHGGGGTEILPAMEQALSLPGTENYSRSLIVITDGYVQVEKEVFELIRKSLGSANMFSFGIGSSVNRFLIEGIARMGMGEPFIITKPEEASSIAGKFREYIQSPVLTRAELDFGRFDIYDAEPPGVPDVLAKRPVIVFGKWRGKPKGKITLNAISGDKPYETTLDVSKFKARNINSGIRYLWARHKISVLSDFNTVQPDDRQVKEITELGLKYNLLTAYTSFVAIDSLVRQKGGESATVQQPLPLPQGVSDYAVGGLTRSASKMIRGPASASPPIAQTESTASKPEPAKEEAADEKSDISKQVANIQEKMVIKGKLSKDDCLKLLDDHIDQIALCYNDALKIDPSLKGEAVLTVFVDKDGRINKVTFKFVSSGIKAGDMEKCITGLFTGESIGAPSDGKTASVAYDLRFTI